MAAAKKELEIVYDLQWKHGSGHGEDRANIVGMYDIPATTLNWDTFKSYLLKNCGATGDDVKVSYVSVDDKEFPINSQLDFHIALYSFRQRARNGDVITLRLDRVSSQGCVGRTKRLRHSLDSKDLKPQAEMESQMPAASVPEKLSDGPPDWFKQFMSTMKQEIVEEVTAVINNNLASVKAAAPIQVPCHHSRKLKAECSKRQRKISFGKDEKIQRKLDFKIEKLEQKTLKVKEKKIALSQYNADGLGQIGSDLWIYNLDPLMDAFSIARRDLITVNLPGGVTYHQEWEIVNSGETDWTDDTELHYAWGSETLKPVEKIVKCPHLVPSAKGKIAVDLEIPDKAGRYECYWHFHHKGRRFGHWLGCVVNVESSLATPISLYSNNQKKLDEALCTMNSCSSPTTKNLTTDNYNQDAVCDENTYESKYISDMPCDDASKKCLNIEMEQLKICDGPAASISVCSLDCDNQSIISLADSNSTRSPPGDDFVVVPMDSLESETKAAEAIPNSYESDCGGIELEATGDEDILISFVKNEKINDGIVPENRDCSGFAYITVDGKKFSVPKYLLRPDYLETAEDAPSPNHTLNVSSAGSLLDVSKSKVEIEDVPDDSEDQLKFDHNPASSGFDSADSEQGDAASPTNASNSESLTKTNTMSKSRLFVFPSNCPGFEVVYPSETAVPTNVKAPEQQQGDQHASQKEVQSSNQGMFCPSNYLYMNPCNSAWSSGYPSKNLFGMSYGYSNMPVMGALPSYPIMAPVIPLSQNSSRSNYYTYQEPHYQTPYSNMKGGAYQEPQYRAPYSNMKGGAYQEPQYRAPYANMKGAAYEEPQYRAPCSNMKGGAYQGPWPSFKNPKIRPVQTKENNNRSYYQPQASPVHLQSLSGSFNGCQAEKGRSYNNAQLPAMHSPFPPDKKLLDKQTTTAKKLETPTLPNALVTGAVNVASSAVNTARSVLNMFSPQPTQQQPHWPQDSWNSGNPPHSYDMALHVLSDMGFWDHERNMALLVRYNGDLSRVISELVR